MKLSQGVEPDPEGWFDPNYRRCHFLNVKNRPIFR